MSEWDSMEAEYAVMGLHPASHVMAHLRKQLGKGVITSTELAGMEDGTRVTVAGWIIRRQRPSGNAVYVTHSPFELICGDHSRQSSTLPAVLLVNSLDKLLADVPGKV